MTDGFTNQMRSYIVLTETLEQEEPEGEVEAGNDETEVTEGVTAVVLADLRDLSFKLRSFMESEAHGDFALGLEMGMQRAADMIENLIERHTKD